MLRTRRARAAQRLIAAGWLLLATQFATAGTPVRTTPNPPAPAAPKRSLEFAIGTALPAGVVVQRSSAAGFYNAAGNLQSAPANSPAYGYDPVSHQPLGLLLQPASANYVRNGNWTNASAATDLTTFNSYGSTGTPNGFTTGSWGGLPSNTTFIFPAGGSWGWQIAGKGVYANTPYLDLRLKLANPTAASLYFRFALSLSAGVPAGPRQTWTLATLASLVAGSLPANSSLRLTLRTLNGTAGVTTFDVGQTVATWPAISPLATTQVTDATNVTAIEPLMTLAVGAGESADVTVRLMQPQLEPLGLPTSPIPSVNTGFPTRAADRLQIAVPDGIWNLRLSSAWGNYDLTGLVAAGGQGLSVSPPAAAFDAGVSAFRGVLVTEASLPQDLARLWWSPPVLGSLVHAVNVPAGACYLPTPTETSPVDGHAYGSSSYYEPNVDVVARMPQAPLNCNLKVVGGRHVRLIGGAVQPTGTLPNGYLTNFIGQSGSVFLEGLLIDGGQTPTQADGVDINGTNTMNPARPSYAPDIYLENTRIQGIHGHYDLTVGGNLHADCVQTQGPVGMIYADKLTCGSAYQGLFLPPQAATGGIVLRRYNGFYQAYNVGGADDPVSYRLWLHDPVAARPTEPFPPVVLDRVYLTPRAGQDFATQTVWPATSPTTDPVIAASLVNGMLLFPPIMNTVGVALKGPPPSGDFAPLQGVGVLYRSPGYLN